MKPEKLQELKSLLVDGQFISAEQLQQAENHPQNSGQDFTDSLVRLGYIKDQELGQLIAEVNNWKFVNLSGQKIDQEVMKKIDEQFARSKKVLAYHADDQYVELAMNNPEDTQAIHHLQKLFPQSIRPHYATNSDIDSKLRLYKMDIKEQFQSMLQAHEALGNTRGEQSDLIINAVNLLIEDGYSRGASDIHIEPQEDKVWIRFRVDGIMYDILNLPRKYHEHLITRIKVMSKLRTDERNAPQDGKINFSLPHDEIDIRISTVPTIQGEKVVMRLLIDHNKSFSLEDLGFRKQDLQKVLANARKPWGMILVTGPTGSGKTTTLYSVLKLLNRREVNITTIEDPVEYNLDGITQIQVNPGADLTFASGLKAIVRQDPDIVMVGEIRDSETASIAINSALTGHLVLSTLHTNDAATTLVRLLEMEIEPFLVTSTVNLAIGQRLVRRICLKCIASKEIEIASLSKKLPDKIIEKLRDGDPNKKYVRVYEGTGCPICRNAGYNGRIGVFEVMEIDDEIRESIMKNANSDDIKAKAVSKGMRTIVDDAIQKVKDGMTTIEEVLRVIKS